MKKGAWKKVPGSESSRAHPPEPGGTRGAPRTERQNGWSLGNERGVTEAGQEGEAVSRQV